MSPLVLRPNASVRLAAADVASLTLLSGEAVFTDQKGLRTLSEGKRVDVSPDGDVVVQALSNARVVVHDKPNPRKPKGIKKSGES